MSPLPTESQGMLVTGAAGFIGYHLCERLLASGTRVVGLDNLEGHYDPALKLERIHRLVRHPGFSFHEADVADEEAVNNALSEAGGPSVVHLAAQVGVGASRHRPRRYAQANVLGMVNILECCREAGVEHLVYASSSSVYGADTPSPFSEGATAVRPLSLYAATKRSGELFAQAAAHAHGQASTGLRFFTVYGPWGRPDMAVYRFALALLRGEPLQVYHQGRIRRDFTFVGDVVEAVVRLLDLGPEPGEARVLNVGPGRPVSLLELITLLEELTGCEAQLSFGTGPTEDAPGTCADPSALRDLVGFAPETPLRQGLGELLEWLRQREQAG